MSEHEEETPEETPTEEPVVDDDPDQDEGAEEEDVPLEGDIPEGVDPETGEVTDEAALADTAAAKRGPEDAEIEKNSKAMNRASQAYIKKVVDTLGTDLQGMETCPLCAETWPGVRFPVMPSPENLARVRVAIGLEPGDNLPHDGYSRTCSTCDGWGRVDSGSKVAAHSTLECYDCKGYGWIPVGDERAPGSVLAGNGTTPTFEQVQTASAAGEAPEAEKLRQLGYIVTKIPKIEPIVGV